MRYSTFLKVPVFGREDDAADKLAAFIMLQFGKDTAARAARLRVVLRGIEPDLTGSDFSDVSGPETQRYYNYLCMALGGDRETFTPILRDTLLKTARAVWCAKEYSGSPVRLQQDDHAARRSRSAEDGPVDGVAEGGRRRRHRNPATASADLDGARAVRFAEWRGG
jgi:hypothetical protein